MRRTAMLVGIALALLAAGAANGAAKPAGVTWGSVHFTDPGKLGSWLSRRGVRYSDWARRHPAAVYLLTHPAPPAQPPVATQRDVGGSTTTTRLGAGVAVFLALAFLLVMVSAAGDVLVRLAGVPIDPQRVNAARLGAAGGGLAVAIGTALAWWL
jgi:hypothetical protein